MRITWATLLGVDLPHSQQTMFFLSFMETIVSKFVGLHLEPNALIWKVPKVFFVAKCLS